MKFTVGKMVGFRGLVWQLVGMSVHACEMGRPGRKAVPVVVTGRQRGQLERLAEEGAERERVRARIVLGAAEGRSNRELVEELGCSEPTVSMWRRRFGRPRSFRTVDQQL
ncbi:MAG: helix-turn-helix domain-containing protein [Actinobacteria bacterium]|nr:helix-turn-helix domain-containing protein [Actinomycetota bacterium]